MTKKYERPLYPLASRTDTLCSDDDASSSDDDFFGSTEDVEYCHRYNEEDDDWKTNPRCMLSAAHRIDQWTETKLTKDPRRDTYGEGFSICSNRKMRSRKWRFFCAFAVLLVGLMWAIIHLGIRNAERKNGLSTRGDDSLDEDATESIETPSDEGESSHSLAGSSPAVDTSDPTNEEPTASPFQVEGVPGSPTESQGTQSPLSPTPTPTTIVAFVPPTENIPTAQVDTPGEIAPTLRPSNAKETFQPTLPSLTAEPTDRPTLQPQTIVQDSFIDQEEVEEEADSVSAMEEVVVLHPNEYLAAGQFRSSPNGKYRVELTAGGDLVLSHHGDTDRSTIWSTKTAGSGVRLYLQDDGNMLLRNDQKATIWTTETHGYPGARVILTDNGKLSIQNQDLYPALNAATSVSTAIWMDGVPRSIYRGPPPPTEELEFPVRGAFYYPWYPQTWTVNGAKARYDSAMGEYSSSDPQVAISHIDAMDYAHIDLSIASWWGPDTHLDKARLTMLMDHTVAMNSPLKWSIYHEEERDFNPSAGEIRSDLDYLKKWFAWHEAWAHKDGKPVIFVYNEAGCDVAQRWSDASNGEWFVVLKLFPGFQNCPYQPDSWHQYGCGEVDGTIHNPGHSFVLSPGFWRADKEVPLLPRVNQDTFCKNAERMVASGEQWQLVVSFNEAGEGTMIENSPDWPSNSGYGQYLDCLNRHH